MPVILSTSRRLSSLSCIAFTFLCSGVSIVHSHPLETRALGPCFRRDHAVECGESDRPFQLYITGVAHDSGVTHDTRYAAWEFGGRSWCQGAVQEIELVPKTEVGADPKLNRDERPPTGQLEEALWFRCRFRRRFQFAASKVPFSESGLREGDFRFTATKVPFSEVVGWKGPLRAVGSGKYAGVCSPRSWSLRVP